MRAAALLVESVWQGKTSLTRMFGDLTSNPSPLKEPTARAGSAALAARKGCEWLRLPLQCYHTTRAVRPPNPTSPASSNPFRPKKAALGGHGYFVGTNQELYVILMSMVFRLFASSCHNAYTSVLIHGQRDSSIASCWLLCILPCVFLRMFRDY
jgi:hypothetical protein